jgi:transposase
MIRPSDSGPLVYLCVAPVDGRKAINGLALLVQDTLELNPFCEQLFVFTNRRRDRCKILYWERSGFVLWLKRLDKARFAWPKAGEHEAVLTLEASQLNLLLDGYNIWQMRPHERLLYEVV